jgi:hypothetical protein
MNKEKMLDHIYEMFILVDDIKDSKDRLDVINKLGDIEDIIKTLSK